MFEKVSTTSKAAPTTVAPFKNLPNFVADLKFVSPSLTEPMSPFSLVIPFHRPLPASLKLISLVNSSFSRLPVVDTIDFPTLATLVLNRVVFVKDSKTLLNSSLYLV